MKKTVFILMFIFVASAIEAQVISNRYEKDEVFKIHPQLKQKKAKSPQKKMAIVNVQKLIEEDRQLAKMDRPFRFGYGFDVHYSLNDGIWEENDSSKIWSMNISSLGAYSLNFIFQQLFLAEGAQLFIYNNDKSMVYGPVISEQNAVGEHFLTDLIAGDEVTIQLIEPKNIKQPSSLIISKVIHGYIDVLSYPAIGNADYDNCHNDINCYSTWDTESDAVALVLLSGGDVLCSGSLLNNVQQDYKAYFLSAFHCVDLDENGSISTTEKNNAQNWAFRFQYKKTTCNGSTATSYITYNQATFRAAWANSDFVLMELVSSAVQNNVALTFLGWDRSGNVPTQGTGIHHPRGDVMKISFDTNPLSSTTPYLTGTHWLVEFDNGIVEHGSSGSPIFNQNKRVIGQLHSGSVKCPPMTAYYGRFSASWAGGGTNDSRLSNWLDPLGTNPTTLNSIAYNPTTISGASSLYNFQQSTYTLNNLPSNTTITWSGSSNVNIISGQGTSQVTISICSGSTATLTATLSGTVNQVLNKALEVKAGDLYATPYISHVEVELYNPYAQCFDWEIGNSLTSIIGNGNINCSSYNSLAFTTLNGADGGNVAVRARKDNCYSNWQGSTISLWRPEIDGACSYFNPVSGEPFYACIGNMPSYMTYGNVEFYWYIDDYLIDVTTEPSVYTYNWPCGYSTHCYVIAVIDNDIEISSPHVDFWGMCTGGGGWSTYSAAYPNPAGNELIINRETKNNEVSTNTIIGEQKAKANTATVKVLLYSHSTTKLVYSKDFSASAEQIRIDTSKLPNGVYYLNMVENNEKIKEQTIIINH
jgi:hypothetical protein